MIKVATRGVIDHTEAHTKNVLEARPNMLIDNAAPTARESTRTEKMTPLLVSVSFVNIVQTSLFGCLSCSIEDRRIGTHPPLGGVSGGVISSTLAIFERKG